MSKSNRIIFTVLFAVGVFAVLFVALMPPRGDAMGGITCPRCVVGWVGGVFAVGLIAWLAYIFNRRAH